MKTNPAQTPRARNVRPFDRIKRPYSHLQDGFTMNPPTRTRRRKSGRCQTGVGRCSVQKSGLPNKRNERERKGRIRKKGEQDFHLLSSFPSGTNWNRTSDTRIFSPLLYQLSYRAILFKRPTFRPSIEFASRERGCKDSTIFLTTKIFLYFCIGTAKKNPGIRPSRKKGEWQTRRQEASRLAGKGLQTFRSYFRPTSAKQTNPYYGLIQFCRLREDFLPLGQRRRRFHALFPQQEEPKRRP